MKLPIQLAGRAPAANYRVTPALALMIAISLTATIAPAAPSASSTLSSDQGSTESVSVTYKGPPISVTDGGSVVVSPGSGSVNGTAVNVETTATLAFPPADIVAVRDEKSTLPATLPHRWFGGNLRQVRTANAIPGSFIPESLRVRLEDGTLLEREKDYLVEETWASIARTPAGRIATDTVVLVDYDYSLMRLDSIDVTQDGQAVAVPGEPHLVCPVPPPLTTGSVRLANVFQPYKSSAVEPWQIFPIGSPFPEPTHQQQVEMSRPVSETLQKLRDGKSVTIVTWGDSVTVGGDTSRPELTFANLFVSRLAERFPQAQIKHVNAGIGGTTTRDRLPGLESDVLAHKPDLVTIEFVNDIQLPADEMKKNWNDALPRMKAVGAEVIVITPHFTTSMLAMHPHPRGPETRPSVELQKKLATDHGVALADTSRRWAHLEKEGIPYITLLYNGINHPNDAGHELFVKDLLNLFPAQE